MAEGLNRVMLFGNVGAEPELRQAGNSAVLNIRLATTEHFLDKNRVRQERTEWHSIKIWGPRGEALSKIIHKGDRLFVEGRLATQAYQDRSGVKREKTEVVASNVLLNGRPGGSNRPSAPVADPDKGGDDYGGDYGPEDAGL